MALILAVNPGNVHNPTLSRLARELRGCEIVGADSCAVAIKAIKKRVPDILLLPATPPRGEADLRAHLRTIRGGVPTLKLPPVETADPLDLVRQIRELLTGVPATAPATAPASVPVSAPASAHSTPPKASAPAPREAVPVGASPDLLAAAAATISWIRARREQWSEPFEPYDFDPVREDRGERGDRGIHETDASYEPYEPHAPHEPEYYEPIELPDEPHDPQDSIEPRDPHVPAGMAAFLPRAAAIAAVVGIVGAAAWYWTQTGRSPSSEVEPAARPNAAPVETTLPPVATPGPVIEATIAAPPPQPVAVVSPFEVTISAGGQLVPLDPQGRAMLVPGKYRLRFQNSERGYDETRAVQVRPGETITLTLSPETTIRVTSDEPAEVQIDGTRVGDTPYQGKMSLGAHTVTVKTAGAERQVNVDATSKPVQLEMDFSKP